MTKGERVLHRLHPDWGVGVVLREKWPGWLVRFEVSHTFDGVVWADTWICSPGHLDPAGDLSEIQLHNAVEALKAIRKMGKGERK